MESKADITKEIARRIRIAMCGASVNDTAKRAGLSRGTLESLLERGATPRVDTLMKLIDYYSLDANWVLFGHGERERGEPVLSPMVQIPLLKSETIVAGIPTDVHLTSVVSVRLPRRHVEDEKCLYALEVEGNSMSPEIQNEGYVVFNTMDNDPEAHPGSVMVVSLPDQSGIVVKHVQIGVKTFSLMSTNPEYPDLLFLRDRIHPNAVIGRVLYVIQPDGRFAMIAD